MNTYIMDALSKFKNILSAEDGLSFEIVDSITGEFEMMKMEIKLLV